MLLKKNVVIGLVAATLLHVLVFTGHLSSPVLFPGFVAHFLITGLHGDDGILGAIASLAEVLINGMLYGWAIFLVSRVVEAVRR